MKPLFASIAILCSVMVPASTACADVETDALDAIKSVDGKVFRDTKDSTEPVVNVIFKSGEDPIDQVLPHLKSFPKLRALSFPYVKSLDDEGMKSLGKLTGLTSLSLVGTSITDKGVEQLAGLKNLETLQLSNSAVTDAGLKHLRGMVKLRYLGLNATKVTGAGFAYLRELPDLEKITLFNTPTTDIAVKHLAACKSLKRIELKKTRVSETGEAELRKALPELEID